MLTLTVAEKGLKVISFDIFDTILFRTVRVPQEVFEIMFLQRPDLFPAQFVKGEWRALRILAEKIARQVKERELGTTEVTLEEIYQQLPDSLPNKAEILDLEVSCECQVCYINPEMMRILQQIRQSGDQRKMIFCSDMYLSKEKILRILRFNNFDLTLIDDLFISCEYGISKRKKGLFEIILQKYQLKPEELLHIGDNEISDGCSPRQLGIKTHLYDVISAAVRNHAFLPLEGFIYENPVKELYALRNLVGSNLGTEDEEEKWWRMLGAMILGPFFCGATEWVLNTAEENGVDHVYPMMREGAFLGELLRRSAKQRKMSLHIEKLFISRNAVYLPSLSVVNDKDVMYILRTYNITIRDVFRGLGIEALQAPFTDHLDVRTNQARKILFGDSNLYDQLKQYLLQDDVKATISRSAQKSREDILSYFKVLGLDKRSITLDVGCRGSIQLCMDKILQEAGIKEKNIHLLFVGKDALVEKVLDNVDIRGYAEAYADEGKIVGHVFVRLLELFSMCEEGTTLGYRNENGKVDPITQKIEYPNQNQYVQMKQIQEGIFIYQKAFFELAAKKEQVRDVVRKPFELLKIMTRLFSAPLSIEARKLGDWFYDQNFGANIMQQIINKDDLAFACDHGLDTFLARNNHSSIEWYPGLSVLMDPLIFHKRVFMFRGAYQQYDYVLFVQKIVDEFRDVDSVVIFGAGQAGRTINAYLNLYQSNLKVEAFVDNNVELQGMEIAGIPICSIKETFKSCHYIVGSFAFINELREQVKKEKGSDVKIIAYT